MNHLFVEQLSDDQNAREKFYECCKVFILKFI